MRCRGSSCSAGRCGAGRCGAGRCGAVVVDAVVTDVTRDSIYFMNVSANLLTPPFDISLPSSTFPKNSHGSDAFFLDTITHTSTIRRTSRLHMPLQQPGSLFFAPSIAKGSIFFFFFFFFPWRMFLAFVGSILSFLRSVYFNNPIYPILDSRSEVGGKSNPG